MWTSRTTFADRGHKTKRLAVSHAFHSALMDPMLDDFRAVAAGLTYQEPTIPLVSTVTGEPVAEELGTPDYWVRQVRGAVRFADAVATLAGLGVTRYLEVGPDAVLTGMAGQMPRDTRRPWCPRCAANRDEVGALLAALAGLHVSGAGPDWAAVFAGRASADRPAHLRLRAPAVLAQAGARRRRRRPGSAWSRSSTTC